MPARALRNGKKYTKFMEDVFVVDHFRVSDLVTHHATGPQDESDHSDVESERDLSELDDDDYKDEPLLPPKPCLPWSPHTPLHRNRATQIPPAPGAHLTRKEQKAACHCAARAAKREVLCKTAGYSKTPKAISLARTSQSSPTHVEFRVDSHRGVASSEWMGLLHPETDLEPEAREYSFEEAQAIPGMRQTRSLSGRRRVRVWGVRRPTPRPRLAKNVAEPAAKLMDEAASNMYDCVFHGVYYGTRKQEKKQCAAPEPRRHGTHRSDSMGSPMGGGQQFPTHFFLTTLRKIVLTGLLAQKPFQRIAGFANTIFQCFAPDLHAYYGSTMDKLHEWNPLLKRNFATKISVFAAATFNFGPRTVTFPHIDFANLAWGWCAITALGNFDPDKGGHLILWDLKLIIRFPRAPPYQYRPPSFTTQTR
ncbi:hypothetical protein B0H14DRAFT_2648002 [Mycena olivaceomarginata]|nr:hypothetical protein B0H14DRAFT_2648002 [Mycena olivaceomarginata]